MPYIKFNILVQIIVLKNSFEIQMSRILSSVSYIPKFSLTMMGIIGITMLDSIMIDKDILYYLHFGAAAEIDWYVAFGYSAWAAILSSP